MAIARLPVAVLEVLVFTVAVTVHLVTVRAWRR